MSKKRLLWLVLIVLVVASLWQAWRHRFGAPEDFAHMEAQFKYGSIGADHPLAQAPIPYWLWKALPELFDPATVIPSPHGPKNGLKGLDAFGLVTEQRTDARDLPDGHAAGSPVFERPIGFSKRRVFGMDFVGMNCAFCHQGTLRASAADKPQVILGGVGQSVDIEQYFLFLFSALTHPDFTADKVMPAVERALARQKAELGWFQRLLYRYLIIPIVPTYLASMERGKFDFIYPNNPSRLPDFGPGRVDTWGLYKRVFVHPPQDDQISGSVDFPPLWNQKAREGFRMHWDGNTDVLVERNVISALSLIGSRIEYLDFARLTRVTDWIIGLLPPRYEDHLPASLIRPGQQAIDGPLAKRGEALFSDHCARCHAAGGDRIGRVEPIAGLGTSARRIEEFTPELAASLNTLGTSQWQLRHFRVQNGYVNTLLDGVWLKAPYLHNGSVPTLRDLLNEPARRPKQFCRGSDLYDWKNLGWLSATVPDAQGKPSCPTSFFYDTTVSHQGKSNAGHGYGTWLPDADKDALVEFMKTL